VKQGELNVFLIAKYPVKVYFNAKVMMYEFVNTYFKENKTEKIRKRFIIKCDVLVSNPLNIAHE
jgi:hypothetical protein